MFISHCQRPGEEAEDFADELRKLFRLAYPEEDISSNILLQRFITGLLAPVSHQVLSRGKLMTFAQASKNATEIEYALNFEKQSERERDINAISQPNLMDHPKLSAQLQQTLKTMSNRLEALESRLQTNAAHYPAQNCCHGNGAGRFVAAVSSRVHSVASHFVVWTLRRQPFRRGYMYTSSPAASSRGQFVTCRFVAGMLCRWSTKKTWNSPELEDNVSNSVQTVPIHCTCSVSYVYNLYALVLYIHTYINSNKF